MGSSTRSSKRSPSRPQTTSRSAAPLINRVRAHWLRHLDKLAVRRQQAAALFRNRIYQAEVARRLGVSRQSVSRWYDRWRQGGQRALQASLQVGRPTRLIRPQQQQVRRALLRGARAHGYPTELWTLRRVAEVIERTTGVRYHPGHVWRLLHHLGWSRQKPARRAAERDEDKIQLFLHERWPQVKKGRGAGTPGSSSSMKPGSRSSPRSAPHGRPKGRPRSSATDSGTG